jgi:type II secretory ATPase GspE/PulE/Tfp pilus assembly ATPase PilB-like protein
VKKLYLYRGKGCDRCNYSGYSGRIGIFEVMKVTEEIGNLMLENVAASAFENIGIKNGMLTMIQDGYLKAMEGITTVEEVLRVSKE